VKVLRKRGKVKDQLAKRECGMVRTSASCESCSQGKHGIAPKGTHWGGKHQDLGINTMMGGNITVCITHSPLEQGARERQAGSIGRMDQKGREKVIPDGMKLKCGF